MSPSPTPKHQKVAGEIHFQLKLFLRSNPVGEVFQEVDAGLGQGLAGGDLVYRPDVVFLQPEKAARNWHRLAEPPDLIVEVVSASSRRYDNETKKDDYERCGVAEYWIIDPDQDAMTFYRLRGGRYVEVQPDGNSLKSEAVPGFVLDLERVRQAFRVGSKP